MKFRIVGLWLAGFLLGTCLQGRWAAAPTDFGVVTRIEASSIEPAAAIVEEATFLPDLRIAPVQQAAPEPTPEPTPPRVAPVQPAARSAPVATVTVVISGWPIPEHPASTVPFVPLDAVSPFFGSTPGPYPAMGMPRAFPSPAMHQRPVGHSHGGSGSSGRR